MGVHDSAVGVTRFVGASSFGDGDLVAGEDDWDPAGVCSLCLVGEDDWREWVCLCSVVEVTAVDGTNGAEERGNTNMGGLASGYVAVMGSGAI